MVLRTALKNSLFLWILLNLSVALITRQTAKFTFEICALWWVASGIQLLTPPAKPTNCFGWGWRVIRSLIYGPFGHGY